MLKFLKIVTRSTPEVIITNGIRFLLSMYGAPKKVTCLDKLRYLSFAKKTYNKKQVQLACLPPTSAAAQQHLFRVYYQVQVWLGNKMNPEDWGWKLVNNAFEPIQRYSHLHQKNSLTQSFAIVKKVAMLNAAVKRLDCFVL